ncbi:hypothetical protein HDU83_003806 [Entophlyctis luteolus]|nr:hypothetical protein HDU83_003806 [Entophlyctis luteolus]
MQHRDDLSHPYSPQQLQHIQQMQQQQMYQQQQMQLLPPPSAHGSAVLPFQYAPAGVPVMPPVMPPPPPPANKVSAWIRDTPLPTALASRLASDSSDESEDRDNNNSRAVSNNRSRRSKRKASKSGMSIRPGHSATTHATPVPVVKSADERRVERTAESRATTLGIRVNKAVWVSPVGHDPSSIHYDPAKPLSSAAPSVAVPPRVRHAVSGKEARELLRRANEDEDESSSSASSPSPHHSRGNSAHVSDKEDVVDDDNNDVDDDDEDDEKGESAMDRVRDRLRQLAMEKAGVASEESPTAPGEPADDSDLRDDETASAYNIADDTDNAFPFLKPGHGRSANKVLSTGFSNMNNNLEDVTSARDLVSDSDFSDGDDSDLEVLAKIPNIAFHPVQAKNAELAETDGADGAEAEVNGQIAGTGAAAEESLARTQIYSDHVPRAQFPKSDPQGALEAVLAILPLIQKISSYPVDQKSLATLCFDVLERIATLTNMKLAVVAEAQLVLARMYVEGIPGIDEDNGFDMKPDFGRAFALYKSAGKRGNVDGVFNVALCHEKGIGTSVSYAKAVHNYKKAALRNHPGAMFRLGTALQKGNLGLAVNQRDSIKWLRLATKYATKTFPHAVYEYAILHDKGVSGLLYPDHEFMVQLFHRGASLGHAGCQVKLGDIYGGGLYGFAKNLAKSAFFYSLAAENGSPEGMFELGGLYMQGFEDPNGEFSLPQSTKEAIRWVHLAAECNLPRALFAMGYFAERGIFEEEATVDAKSAKLGAAAGGRPDDKRAQKWYKRAALAGDAKAIARLEAMGIEVDWKAFKKIEAAEAAEAAYVARNGPLPRDERGGRSGRVMKGVAAGLETLKARAGATRPEVDEELDGGAKCIVM